MQCLEVFFLVTDDDVIISDPESEYSPLVERFGGQVIKISPTSTQYINPMDINMNYSDDDNPIALKADFILSLCELIVGGSERRKDAISSEEIVKKYDEILLKGTNENTSNIKQVRFLFEEIFNPDHTVYPNYDHSVVNISSHWLVKKSVPSEARIGRYIFEILSKKIDGKMSPILELLKKSLEIDDDDLTRILKPIIVFPSDKEKRTLNGVNYPEDSEVKWDSCKDTIRKGFDNLANTMVKVPVLLLYVL